MTASGLPDESDDLAIVVVNYGSSALLSRNLAAVAADVPEATIVVVDNFSTDRERMALRALAEPLGWHVVEPDDNLGFGTGMNVGVARARELGARRFLLLNPDATIQRPSVQALLARSVAEPLTMLSPVVRRIDGSTWSVGSDVYLSDGRIRSAARRGTVPGERVPWLSGACLLLTDRLWDAAGGFADEYFLYWEDVDLSLRVTRAGGSLALVEEATAVHDEGGTQRADGSHAGAAKSGTYYYYNIRNRLLFAARNLPPETVRAWRRATLPVAWEILLQGGRRQFLTSTEAVRAGWRGIRDGLRLSRTPRHLDEPDY
ncbi:glycosyltransferase family 2 protein [uncultured Leifsonia sp.]|uniref:glycosyltransferase family 2 protein n=1 Tax=uncultured Leifsonia sp. TaxID=340359 RepID=UPI0028D01D6F|nr:glycosyltransferase family 2 protein [uncultured Leifsonia sp.]